MNLTITKPFGSITFTSDSYQDLMQQSTFFASLPESCGFKGCTGRLYLEHQRPTAKQGKNAGKTYNYYYLKCSEGHELQLREREADRYPYHLNDWKQSPNQTLEPETYTESEPPQEETPVYLEPQEVARLQRALKSFGFISIIQQQKLINNCLQREVKTPWLLTKQESIKIYRCAEKQSQTSSSENFPPAEFDDLQSASEGWA